MVASGSYLPRMRTVGLKILNSKLSEYIRLAASGETVLVTDRDRVVAEIVPPRAEKKPNPGGCTPCRRSAPRAVDAARSGGRGPPPAPAPVATLEELMAELDEDRADR